LRIACRRARQCQGRVDANGNPTNDSTPAEKAETAAINNQVRAANAAADAKAQAQQLAVSEPVAEKSGRAEALSERQGQLR
jgi:hypothetical protein